MKRKLVCSIFSVLLIVSVANVHAQTPGQIPVFDQPGTGACNNAGSNDCVDSVITQSGGNIGIGTTTPAAKLDVVGGNVNLENSTATSGNILKGGTPFLHNYGNFNTFLGLNAGNFTLTGSYNTASGVGALFNNTTGGDNTATGFDALPTNTTGSDNTATGFKAMFLNTTGQSNTATGVLALYNNTIGNGNTASGWAALGNNTTGGGNTASGLQALYSNTTGSYNTASGTLALYYNTTGDSNTASGLQALFNNTTGGGNTASGYYALRVNTTGSDNTASGASALQNNTSGIYNTADGVNALLDNSTGLGNTGIGFGANVSQGDLSNATAIGYNAVVNASNKVRLGNLAVTVVEGPPYSTVSDKNAKENFKSIDAEEVLEKVRAIPVTSWNYIGQDVKQFRHYGPVAQDFFAAFGDDGVGKIGSPTTITSTDMNGVLMLAVQALGRENDEFKAENAELKARIEALERLMEKSLK
jgi:hypothetical protein